MLKPESMSKIIIVGTKKMLPAVIEELHNLKAIHIIEHSRTGDFDIGSPLEQANILAEILVKIRSICSYLKVDLNQKIDYKILEDYSKHRTDKEHHYKLGSTAKDLYLEVVEKLDRIQEIENRVVELTEFSKIVRLLSSINLDLEDYRGYKSIASIIGILKDSRINVKPAVQQATHRFQLFEGEFEKQKIIAIFAEKNAREGILEELSKVSKTGFLEIQVPEKFRDYRGKPEKILQQIETENRKLASEKNEINNYIKLLSNKWADFLRINERILSMEIDKAEAPLKFASSSKTFAVSGWVPESKVNTAVEAVRECTQDKGYIEVKKPEKKENVPVRLSNPKKVRDFEFFLDLYALPKYQELDPTFFIFLTFPFFFGFMLGDIGYGLVTLAIFFLLKKKIRSRLMDIMIFSSVITILFGFIFGEFFGEEAIFGIAIPHLISRAHEINNLLAIAIVIGVVHINIGLILGFINTLKNHGLKEAVMEKISWILLEAGVALIALSALKKISLSAYGVDYGIYAGILVASSAVVMLYLAEGPKGLIELPSIFSNMLSYARLMAVGLASVILAVLVNDFSREFFTQGGFYVLAGILLLVVGHLINLMLGIIGPFLHSLRLNYVEFFSKFYEGGGKRYEPFGADKNDEIR